MKTPGNIETHTIIRITCTLYMRNARCSMPLERHEKKQYKTINIVKEVEPCYISTSQALLSYFH